MYEMASRHIAVDAPASVQHSFGNTNLLERIDGCNRQSGVPISSSLWMVLWFLESDQGHRFQQHKNAN